MDAAVHCIDQACATAVGRRAENQDRCVVTTGLGVVSDGVGGHAGGARAAELTVHAVVESLVERVATGAGPVDEAPLATAVAGAVQAANDAVRRGRHEDPALGRMGATVALAAALELGPDGSRWLVAHVGDSPAWQVSPVGCARLTHDHTVTAELVRAGAVEAVDADTHPGRHVLARAIGPEERVAPDVVRVALRPGEVLVLASDGLADVLGPEDIHRLAGDPRPTAGTAADAAERLVRASLDAGTTDNVTVVVVRQLASSPDGPDPVADRHA